jgi:hypothetical protein
MEEANRNSGQGLGIAALIMGIISFVVAFIPCVGILAIFTSVVAVVLGAIGLSQATRAGSPHKGLNTGGLVVGIIALFVAIVQIAVVVGISNNADGFGKSIEKIVTDIQDDVLKEIEDGNLRITIEEGDEKTEINVSSNREELLNKLDKLEKLDQLDKPDSLKETKPDTTLSK